MRAPLHTLVNTRGFSARAGNTLGLLPDYLKTPRPDGVVNWSIAENRIDPRCLVDKIDRIAKETDFTQDMVYYQDTHGMPESRAAMVHHWNTRLLAKPYSFDEDDIIITAGCNAALESLFAAICDPGDQVLVPTPAYATFPFDLGARVGVEVVDAPFIAPFPDPDYTDPSTYVPTIASLEAGWEAAKSKSNGGEVKALLITNPHNPLATVYSEAELRLMLDWCTSKGIHLVSDEIYAGSVHSGPYTSLLELGPLPENASIVYALSKDFCVSGLRYGMLTSGSQPLLESMRKMNDLCQVPSHTQAVVSNMLNDAWATTFLKHNQSLVRQRYLQLTEVLDECGVPHLPAVAGMFNYFDLRKWMNDGESEGDFYLRLMHEHGICMTPGRSMGMPVDGFFRCVFTAADSVDWDEGLERLERLCGSATDDYAR